MSHVVKSIETGSPLRGKIQPGCELIAINGHEIEDVLDYKYYSYDRKLELSFKTPEGKSKTVKIRKGEGEDLGLEFESYLMDNPRGCSNRCLFCFVDQLPRGMRRTLYFKDDDARLSFLTGNYITLTNLSDREIDRICQLRISPINVSVHATEPELRAKLLGNPAAARGFELMQRLSNAGIVMDCQIVCCPGINDGEALDRTMRDLETLYPQVNSVSVVPVGLTKHRDKLPELKPFDKESASKTVLQVEKFSEECLERHGSRIFFCSDELYLKAERSELPDEDFYEGYPQLENGVGMLRSLIEEFVFALEDEDENSGAGPFAVATGVSAAPFIEKLMLTAQKKCDRIKGAVFTIENDFFGHTVDVAGLVTGGDLIRQLQGKELGERLLIPENMLRHGETVFLDDVSVEELEKALGVPVRPVPQDGAELLSAMLGR